MSTWANRRKLLFELITAVVLIVLVGIPVYLHFHKTPTCFDGLKNGNEEGVDCGGSCERLCQSSFLPPSVTWTRFEKVAEGLYNISTYIINPNTEGQANNIPYHVALYDDRGVLITDVYGTVTLAPHRNAITFNAAVSVGKRIPATATFEFTNYPNWFKQKDQLSALRVKDKNYTEDDKSGSLAVTLENTSVYPIGKLVVGAVLYDKDGNALGFSQTIVDGINPRSSAVAPFTWPLGRNGAVVSIEVLPVAVYSQL